MEDESELPVALGKVARRELAVHGITRLEQLTSVAASELLKIHGVGPKAVRILAEELDTRGMHFAGEQSGARLTQGLATTTDAVTPRRAG